MISVRNRLPPSNGNKWFVFLLTGLVIAACSPKVRRGIQPENKIEKPPVNVIPEVKPLKPAAPKVPAISLILPFGLNHLAPGAAYSSVSLKEADIAVGYYRGFKLALDSLTSLG